jgi:TonB family protein
MLSQTNDGWWLWAVRIELAAALILCSGVVQAQAPQSKSGGCEMRSLNAPKPVYPPRQPKSNEVLKSSVVVDLVVKEDGTVKSLHLSRSCGIPDYDKAIVKALKRWRYNAASGCVERTSKVTVNISPRE